MPLPTTSSAINKQRQSIEIYLDGAIVESPARYTSRSPSPPLSPGKKKTTLRKHRPASTIDHFGTNSSSTYTAMATPARPSRVNTDTLHDLFSGGPQPAALAQRRISAPAPPRTEEFYADPAESMPPVASTSAQTPQMKRSGTTKSKRGMAGFMSQFLGSNKSVAISTRKSARRAGHAQI